MFSDGHGIARFTSWFDNLGDLDKVDWEAVYAKIWRDTAKPFIGLEDPRRSLMKTSRNGK